MRRKESRIGGVYWRHVRFMRQLLLHTTVVLSLSLSLFLSASLRLCTFIRRIERRNILPINTILSSRNFKWCRRAFVLRVLQYRPWQTRPSLVPSRSSLLLPTEPQLAAVISRRVASRVSCATKPPIHRRGLSSRKLFYDPFAPLLIPPWLHALNERV